MQGRCKETGNQYGALHRPISTKRDSANNPQKKQASTTPLKPETSKCLTEPEKPIGEETGRTLPRQTPPSARIKVSKTANRQMLPFPKDSKPFLQEQ